MDVFLLTSRVEGMPNTVLEAQAVGVPVVAVDVGGVSEALAAGETGHAVAEDDPGKLADRVCAVLADRAWRAAVRSRGPAFVRERFGLRRMVAETLAAYGLDVPASQPASRPPPGRG
jgi:glycosyltransferase involved in cell wall biosynthesis